VCVLVLVVLVVLVVVILGTKPRVSLHVQQE
jgi:hypothetical protein